MFLETSIRDWPSKIKKLKLTAHVQDISSVEEYVRLFNKHYKEEVKESDMRDNEAVQVPLSEI